jgi:hypothetical protein
MEQKGLYERVVIDRKNETVYVDRMDINWKSDGPFMGRRDSFAPSIKEEGALDFIRYDYWLSKFLKFDYQVISHYSAWSYRRAFRNLN